MKFKSVLLGSLAMAMVAITNTSAESWDNHTVYTAKGIVEFVRESLDTKMDEMLLMIIFLLSVLLGLFVLAALIVFGCKPRGNRPYKRR